jgi:signal peptide peptidase SppA
MIDLPHIAGRVFGTPLLIARGKLDVILGVLVPRLSGGTLLPREGVAQPAEQVALMPGAIAVVSVVGTLVARSSYLHAESGLLSYGAIGDAVESAFADASVRGVILDIDSSGGEVGGLFDLVSRIAALKRAGDKPVWAVANEDALSAAYAIACAADRIYVTQTGEVGSIGVVAAHVDESGADAQAGLSWSFIFAGQEKVDGNGHEPLSARARSSIQADVDRLYGQFCELVSANRRLSVEAVRATQAATFRGELAIRAGLADRLGTLDLALSEMAADLDAVPSSTPPIYLPQRSTSMSTEPGPEVLTNPPTPENDPAAAPATPALAASPETPPSPAITPVAAAPVNPADALRSEYAEIASLAAQAARLGVSIDAADAMRKGVSLDALRRQVLETLASRAEATSVITAAPSAPTTADSPIVRRARERAAAARS